MKRHIFVDLGAYSGDTIEQFKQWRYLAYPSEIEWGIYGFDPNPRFAETWKRIEGAIIKQEAAWIYDGQIEFTLRPDSAPLGSTVMKEKRDWGHGEVLLVECFDFSKWLEQFEADHVVIKMDCEGAELPILTKMIEDGTDTIPSLTLVEFHDGKMPTYKSNKHEILEKYSTRLVAYR
jgi:FkbM family methyltransferase